MTPLQGFSKDLFLNHQVVITGAAGGIGRAIAAAFAECGARLVQIDLPKAIELTRCRGRSVERIYG